MQNKENKQNNDTLNDKLQSLFPAFGEIFKKTFAEKIMIQINDAQCLVVTISEFKMNVDMCQVVNNPPKTKPTQKKTPAKKKPAAKATKPDFSEEPEAIKD